MSERKNAVTLAWKPFFFLVEAVPSRSKHHVHNGRRPPAPPSPKPWLDFPRLGRAGPSSPRSPAPPEALGGAVASGVGEELEGFVGAFVRGGDRPTDRAGWFCGYSTGTFLAFAWNVECSSTVLSHPGDRLTPPLQTNFQRKLLILFYFFLYNGPATPV